SVALTILFITTIFMAYNQYASTQDLIYLNNNLLFFSVVGTNTLLILLVFLLSRYQKNEKEVIVNNHSALEHHQKLILNNKDTRYFTWDVKNKKIYLSKKSFSLSKIKSMSSISFEEFISHIQAKDINFYQLANNAIQGKINQIEVSFKYRTNIASKWYKLKGSLLNSTHGSPFISGLLIDITRDKNQEINAQRMQNTLSEVIDSLPLSFVLWNSKNQLVMCNSKYRDFYSLPSSITKPGTSKSEIIQLSTKSLIEIDIKNDQDNQLPGLIGQKEIQLKDKRWILKTDIKTGAGYIASIALDVSDQKISQQNLLDNENELISKVEELDNLRRKQDIQSKQLIELAGRYSTEKDNIEELENNKSKFLLNMSHELRTPLNAIIGFSDFLKNQIIDDPNKVQEYAQDIYESGNELLSIISNIESMTSLEKEDVKINKKSQKINTIFDEVLTDFRDDIMSKKITVKNHFNFRERIFCNETAMRQVISNIISNAIKYNKDGGTIIINNNTQNGWLTLEITDNGHGMTNEEVDIIFKPFNKSRRSNIINQEGARLGLPIANTLIQIHDGNIDVKSTPGKGTCVTVSVPLISHTNDTKTQKSA
ncbi:ATP-binding protein, partial [Gammaproteobacteria bacterium]|nr:ATP-binding protein [Gammaproteobacteria bacterium]